MKSRKRLEERVDASVRQIGQGLKTKTCRFSSFPSTRPLLTNLLTGLLACSLGYGQASVGVQKFGAYDGGPDVIDVGTLQIHLQIPLYHKAGRGQGTGITFTLNDVAPWPTPWVVGPDGKQHNFRTGLGLSIGHVGGSLTNASVTHQCATMPGSGTYSDYAWTYVDALGNSHLFQGTSRSVTDSNNTCASRNITNLGLTSQASDGSGYLIQVGATWGYFPTSITGPSGTVYSPSPQPLVGGLQDANGNSVAFGSAAPGSTCAIASPCMDNGGNIVSYLVQDTVGTSIQLSGGGYSTNFSSRNPLVLTYLDDTGAPQTITLNYKMYQFNVAGTVPEGFLDNITFPDGSAYHVSYVTDSTGALIYMNPPSPTPAALASITLPSGGVISYAYPNGVQASYPSGIDVGTCTVTANCILYTPSLQRTTSDGTTTYTRTITSAAYTPISSSFTQIAKPNGDQSTVYFIVPNTYGVRSNANGTNFSSGWGLDGKVLETKRLEYSHTNLNTPVRTTMRCYNGATGDCTSASVNEPVTQLSVTTTLDGLSSQVITQYSGGLPTEVDEYDFGATSPSRKTVTAYASLGNNIADRPASVTVYDSVGNIAKKTTFTYDEATPSPMTLPGHTTVSGSRGNPTSIYEWTNSVGATRLTKKAYDDAGQVTSVTDPNGNVTSYGYDTATDAYRAKITRPTTGGVAHVSTFGYGPNSGLLTTAYDENNLKTTYGYDSMLRPSSETRPDGGQTTYSYTPTSMTKNVLQKTGTWITSVEQYDAYGRRAHEIGPDGRTTDFTYDSLGRLNTQSNPHFASASATDGVTTYQYDALGRVTQIAPPDGTPPQADSPCLANNVCTQYSGNVTTVTDQAGKQRRSISDALGRLIEVDEPSPSGLANPWATLYTYNGLGNLTCVEQHGDATTGTGCIAPPSSDASSPWRVRRFNYDSLSRLVSSSNPEANTGLTGTPPAPTRVNTTYTYDANGNLLQKTSPAPNQTGLAAQTISYCYDAMNRVTGRAYSAQTCTNGQLPAGTAAVSYSYDQTSFNGLTITNGIGRLTGMSDAAGAVGYSYDPLGRMAAERRTINGVTKSMSYLYYLDGSINTLTYPSGSVITYTPDAAGRAGLVQDIAHNINYVTGTGGPSTFASYNPTGAITGFVNGNSGSFSGITNSFSYNKRLQPVFMSASSPTQTVFSIGYDFHLGAGDNGNVYALTNNKDHTRDQTFTYDQLNRLVSAQNFGSDCNVTLPDTNSKFWGNSYGYDAWGNLLAKNVTKCGAEFLSVVAQANNQLVGFGYDAAGNMNSAPIPTGGQATSIFDAENRMTTSSLGGATTTYTYDGDGNRVEKSNGTTGTLYWYMMPGVVAESDLAGNLQSEYVFFDGERVARKDFPSNAVSYYFSDHLKTTDIVTDAQGNIKNESDFYPWGGELQFLANDSNHYKFTSKERDNDTGLDYFGARYYSQALGRFISADWSATPEPVPYADLLNPQSLNLYTYVDNNPLSRADPDGHCKVEGVSHGFWWCLAYRFVGGKTDEQKAELHKRANEARQLLLRMDLISPNGQTAQEFVNGASDEEVLATERAIVLQLAEQANWWNWANGSSGIPAAGVLLPAGMSNSDFGQKVMKWGTGDDAARARIGSLTREELEQSGVTKEMAKSWRDFYRQVKVANPANPSAQGRMELMQKAYEILGGTD